MICATPPRQNQHFSLQRHAKSNSNRSQGCVEKQQPQNVIQTLENALQNSGLELRQISFGCFQVGQMVPRCIPAPPFQKVTPKCRPKDSKLPPDGCPGAAQMLSRSLENPLGSPLCASQWATWFQYVFPFLHFLTSENASLTRYPQEFQNDQPPEA